MLPFRGAGVVERQLQAATANRAATGDVLSLDVELEADPDSRILADSTVCPHLL